MKPFTKTTIPMSEHENNAARYREQWKKDKLKAALGHEVTEEYLEKVILNSIVQATLDEHYINDVYHVIVTPHQELGLMELSIKRHDRKSIHDWRHLQEIKNQIVGPEHEGMELYPAESRKVDSANQYYLWVVMDPKYRFPFGYTERNVTEGALGKSVNRPFEKTEPQNDNRNAQPA